MNKSEEIIIVDDDSDDMEIIREVYSTLAYENKLLFLMTGRTPISI